MIPSRGPTWLQSGADDRDDADANDSCVVSRSVDAAQKFAKPVESVPKVFRSKNVPWRGMEAEGRAGSDIQCDRPERGATGTGASVSRRGITG